jgi:hypothetical protein
MGSVRKTLGAEDGSMKRDYLRVREEDRLMRRRGT